MPSLHPAEKYARDVIRGKIAACHWIKRACQRYFDDKKNAKVKGLEFRRDKAELTIDFFSEIKLPDGSPMVLEGWTLFLIWNLFGWYRAKHPRWRIENNGKVEDTSGSRRFREAYIEVARKNAKTFLGACIGVKLAFADGKLNAEVYSAATKRDQARICFNDAKRIVETSDFLTEYAGVDVLRNNLSQKRTHSKFEPLSAESKTMDGLRAHGIILDEVHAWRDGETYTKLKRSISTDVSPLIFMITTAGASEESKFCLELHEYSCKVLDGIVEDDTWFCLIYTIDEKDDWEDETVWIKANPYLGISKKWDYMRTEVERAKSDPAQLNNFLRYDLNVWVRSDLKWMPMDKWRLNAGPLPASEFERYLRGRVCYGGLDLSSTTDLTALVFEFPPVPDDPFSYVLAYFFCPQDNIQRRSANDRVPYELWADQGWLIPTPGDVVDEKFILAKVGDAMKSYNVRRLYYDRWGSTAVMLKLQDEYGFTVDLKEHEQRRAPLLVEFGQGYASMSPPMKDFLRAVLAFQYRHGDNPVLNWNMDNLIARMDPAGNIKPDKQKSREKIDGAVALIMAHAGAMIHNPDAGKSVYAERGIIVI